MPRSKRQNTLLRHDQVINHLKKALIYTNELEEMFRPHHPEYSEGYANICLMIAQALEFMEKMRSFV